MSGYPLPMSRAKSKKKRVIPFAIFLLLQDWDDNLCSAIIPDYKVYDDKYCQGYIGILKKNRRYKQYLNVIMKPGGIRPMKKMGAAYNDTMEDRSRKNCFSSYKLNTASKSR